LVDCRRVTAYGGERHSKMRADLFQRGLAAQQADSMIAELKQ
jgi:hypothetical protein